MQIDAAGLNPATLASVKNYYGQILKRNGDLRTSACCSIEDQPAYIRAILDQIDGEILDRFYGCGSPIPMGLRGCTVLDLGCGTGRDAFVASRLVGQDGFVIGVDMTDDQIAIATRHRVTQSERFGYERPNIDFRPGYIERLGDVGIEDASIDVVMSNCVLNLSTDKESAFQEIFRVLKPGGELCFSDVFADRRVPEELRSDPVLYGECLGGAMYLEDFRRLLLRLGCSDFRIVVSSAITVDDPKLAERIGTVSFSSVTVRAFKLSEVVEDRCEDYGQIARYLGTLPEAPHAFRLDDHHLFETGRHMPVCGNTAAMLQDTRYGEHFEVIGDRSRHFGLFDCAESPSAGNTTGSTCC